MTTVDDATFGTRDAKGNWSPKQRIQYPQVMVWPLRPKAIARWLFGWPGYLAPWNLLYFGVACLVWFVLTPSTETMSSFAPGWIALILLRNIGLVLAWYGLFHLRLYRRRSQQQQFKFNGKFPGNKGSQFTFGSQLKDNMFWSLASGVPIWTAYEVVTFWLFASGKIWWITFDNHPVWFVVWMLLIPIFRDLHFYSVHRLIHWPPLYKRVHSLHHRNTNPGPWSGLSMHPVEHLLYFSAVLITWIVPSNPLHASFTLVHLGMAPVPGHSGFDKLVVGDRTLNTDSYAHYLHHKLFEVNYADGVIPLDKWFGSFHDGSPEADAALKARRAARRA